MEELSAVTGCRSTKIVCISNAHWMRTVEVRSGGAQWWGTFKVHSGVVYWRCTVELYIGGVQWSCIWVNLSRALKHFFCHFTWCIVLLEAFKQKLVKHISLLI